MRWHLSRGIVARAPDGRPVRFIGTTVDITDLKRAEEALRQASDRLDLAVRSSNIGIWECDMPDGHIENADVTVINVSGNQNIDGFSSDIIIESSDWSDNSSLDVNTFSGDIRLRLPQSARGNIDFNSFSGAFESDLPVTLNSSSRRNFRGALNGGGNADFRLKTFSGDVSIRR